MPERTALHQSHSMQLEPRMKKREQGLLAFCSVGALPVD